MKRRFYNSRTRRYLHLEIYAPGEYTYKGRHLTAQCLKAIGLQEAPIVEEAPDDPALAFAKPEAYQGGFSNTVNGRIMPMTVNAN